MMNLYRNRPMGRQTENISFGLCKIMLYDCTTKYFLPEVQAKTNFWYRITNKIFLTLYLTRPNSNKSGLVTLQNPSKSIPVILEKSKQPLICYTDLLPASLGQFRRNTIITNVSLEIHKLFRGLHYFSLQYI